MQQRPSFAFLILALLSPGLALAEEPSSEEKAPTLAPRHTVVHGDANPITGTTLATGAVVSANGVEGQVVTGDLGITVQPMGFTSPSGRVDAGLLPVYVGLNGRVTRDAKGDLQNYELEGPGVALVRVDVESRDQKSHAPTGVTYVKGLPANLVAVTDGAGLQQQGIKVSLLSAGYQQNSDDLIGGLRGKLCILGDIPVTSGTASLGPDNQYGDSEAKAAWNLLNITACAGIALPADIGEVTETANLKHQLVFTEDLNGKTNALSSTRFVNQFGLSNIGGSGAGVVYDLQLSNQEQDQNAGTGGTRLQHSVLVQGAF